MEKEKIVRFVFKMPYRTRGLLIKGVARRILNAGNNAFREIPSINSMVNEIVCERLNLPINLASHPATKKTVLMFHLRQSLQEALRADSIEKDIPQNRILAGIIDSTDLSSVTPRRSEDVQNEAKISCSFSVPTTARIKLLREIAYRMLSKKTRIGKSEFASISDVCADLIAFHYNIPLPLEKEEEDFVDEEQINFIILLPESVHNKLKNFCDQRSQDDKKFISMSGTIIEWCENAAQKGYW